MNRELSFIVLSLLVFFTVADLRAQSVSYAYDASGPWPTDEHGNLAPWKHPVFGHEYGHYLQSQEYGWGYLFSVGIPSLISAAKDKGWFAEIDEIGPIADRVEDVSKHQTKWFEMDANRRSYEYFKERGNKWEYKTFPYAIDRIIRFYQLYGNQKYNSIWL